MFSTAVCGGMLKIVQQINYPNPLQASWPMEALIFCFYILIEAPSTLTRKLLYPETFLSVYESFRVHINLFHIEFDRPH